jgi:hypothetical protein
VHRLLPLLAVAACVPPLQEGFEAELVNTGACFDFQVYAAAADDETMLLFRADGALASFPAGRSTTRTFDVGEPGSPTVQVQLGTFLSDLTCDAVEDRGEPTILGTYSAREGSAELTIDRTVDPPLVDLTLSDFRLVEDATSFSTLTVPELVLTGVTWGLRNGEGTDDGTDDGGDVPAE